MSSEHSILPSRLDADSPSHINAETPGAIHEGGELGYALAVSFGAVMDNPNLIVTCVVGDGEAESGPTATLVSPLEDGCKLHFSLDAAHGMRLNISILQNQEQCSPSYI